MSLFSSLFGKSGSDKADQMRQKAIDAFNAIKTPELSQLQVQLDKYVQAGQLTPEQAEAQLLGSNAFNSIATDPSLRGAQKQALIQLQDIGKQGGLTAVDKARMQDITDEQNATARGRNEAIMSNAQERGMGNSGITAVNQLLNEQGAADRASRQGTDVAAQAQQRALQAIQSAGGLGGQMEAQQYGEQANKAQAQNAIDLFNTQTRNASNLYNTQTANQAQAQNLQNAQNVANANTGTTNENKLYNSGQVQQQYNDQLAKANGVAGTFNNWANEANANANKEQAGSAGLLGGLINAGAQAGGYALAGPAGGAVAGQSTNGFDPKKMSTNPEGFSPYAEGGMVQEDPSLDDAYQSFVKKFCYGGSVNMADGGMVHIKPGKQNDNKAVTPTPQLPITSAQGSSDFSLKDPKGQPIGDFKSYVEAVQYADKVREKQPHVEDFSDGGEVPSSTDTAHVSPQKEEPKKEGLLAAIGNLLGSHADTAKQYTFEADGGKVPGIAKVPGDDLKNDVVPAKLSPGEVVIPRSIVAHPEKATDFVKESIKNPMEEALRRLKNPIHTGSVRG